jgi:long-chain acyl-CoA synthetase
MTESNAIGAGATGQDYVNHASSTGRKATIVDLKIVDDQGSDLPDGERGEILIGGPSLFGGYWNLPEADKESFLDGWFKTGDVGYIDEQGYVYIVDRIKDLVIRGGENIGCAEVEAALLEHENIIEASVYAVPDERLGEEVGATIFCNSDVSEPLIRDFLKERIAAFKVPRYIVFSAKPLLRIASGKIDKRLIRQDAWRHWGLTKDAN